MKTVEVFAGTGEGHLKIPSVRAYLRLIQSVIEHLVAHAPKAAAAFLDAVKIGEALGRTWTVITLAKDGERD